jgi:hypothetical protein
MGALTLIPRSNMPPSRARLVALDRRIADAAAQLDTLCRGRDQLRAELSRADSARAALDAMVTEDASSLTARLRSGASWALSHFGSLKAMTLVAQLSESALQRQVGEKALASIEAEIAVAEREIADLKAGKADAVRLVLIEAAAGHREDVAAAITELRESLTIIAGLERVIALSDGSYASPSRIVLELPKIGGRPAEAIVAPEAAIVTAANVWGKYAETVASDALASIDNVLFPRVDPHADDGTVLYDRMTATERKAVDQSRASGV